MIGLPGCMDDEPITALTSEEFSSRALRRSSATG
ncbi:Uncharacterised protein [Mycobacterium tuberculosis]|nr:Uncharacterised protein [Mycobacterium tuberculosis]